MTMTAGVLSLVAFFALGCDSNSADDGADARDEQPDQADVFDSADVVGPEARADDAVRDGEDVVPGDVPGDAPDGEVCEPTAANILGPYYIAGAPERWDLVEPGMAGTRLTISGRVLGPDCAPVPDAVVDVWQADADGVYDNAGWLLRGWSRADADGVWKVHTIVPGRYATGGTFRPAHIHVRVGASGYVLLTTQLYFAGDPYNESDPYYVPSLALVPGALPDGSLTASFDFVLVAE
ncbi:MAG: dioxygenase [Deltaproteobacteria bacterium]|nr:dioxygenase [Deltaproteobacteria bacterium]